MRHFILFIIAFLLTFICVDAQEVGVRKNPGNRTFNITNNKDDVTIKETANTLYVDTTNFRITATTRTGDTTSLKLLDAPKGAIVYMDSLGVGNSNGGGQFAVVDSADAEGMVAFDHTTSGLQWVRLDYLKDGVVNLMWCGAAGDLNTNDSLAFKAALDFIAITGDPLYFPPGRFNVSYSRDTITTPLVIRGAGKDSSIIYNLEYITMAEDLTLEDVSFNNSTTWSATTSDTLAVVFDFDSTISNKPNVYIKDVEACSVRSFIQTVADSVSYALGNPDNQIALGSVEVYNSYFHDMSHHALGFFCEIDYMIVDNCRFKGIVNNINHAVAIIAGQNDDMTVEDMIITNCRFDSIGSTVALSREAHAILFYGDNITITNNQIRGIFGTSVQAEGIRGNGRYVTIADNIFDDAVDGGGEGSITIKQGVDGIQNLIVANNQIHQADETYVMRLNSGGIISNNTIKRTAGANTSLGIGYIRVHVDSNDVSNNTVFSNNHIEGIDYIYFTGGGHNKVLFTSNNIKRVNDGSGNAAIVNGDSVNFFILQDNVIESATTPCFSSGEKIDYIMVEGNKFYNSGLLGAVNAFADSATWIERNTFFDHPSEPPHANRRNITAGCDSLIIKGNSFKTVDRVTRAIYVSGASIFIEDNYFMGDTVIYAIRIDDLVAGDIRYINNNKVITKHDYFVKFRGDNADAHGDVYIINNYCADIEDSFIYYRPTTTYDLINISGNKLPDGVDEDTGTATPTTFYKYLNQGLDTVVGDSLMFIWGNDSLYLYKTQN